METIESEEVELNALHVVGSDYATYAGPAHYYVGTAEVEEFQAFVRLHVYVRVWRDERDGYHTIVVCRVRLRLLSHGAQRGVLPNRELVKRKGDEGGKGDKGEEDKGPKDRATRRYFIHLEYAMGFKFVKERENIGR